jgi:hypothetical protein
VVCGTALGWWDAINVAGREEAELLEPVPGKTRDILPGNHNLAAIDGIDAIDEIEQGR